MRRLILYENQHKASLVHLLFVETEGKTLHVWLTDTQGIKLMSRIFTSPPGQYLGEVGRYTEAADNYVRATQFTPEDFELIFNAANALRQANRNDEAEKFYKKAAKLRPNVSGKRPSSLKWSFFHATIVQAIWKIVLHCFHVSS